MKAVVFPVAKRTMKKPLILAAIALSAMTAMGLASRDLQLVTIDHGPASPAETHLRYYEEARPALIGAVSAWNALCNDEPREMQRTAE